MDDARPRLPARPRLTADGARPVAAPAAGLPRSARRGGATRQAEHALQGLPHRGDEIPPPAARAEAALCDITNQTEVARRVAQGKKCTWYRFILIVEPSDDK